MQFGQLTSAFSHGQSMNVLPGRAFPRRLWRRTGLVRPLYRMSL
jgi:hypothetical protein